MNKKFNQRLVSSMEAGEHFIKDNKEYIKIETYEDNNGLRFNRAYSVIDEEIYIISNTAVGMCYCNDSMPWNNSRNESKLAETLLSIDNNFTEVDNIKHSIAVEMNKLSEIYRVIINTINDKIINEEDDYKLFRSYANSDTIDIINMMINLFIKDKYHPFSHEGVFTDIRVALTDIHNKIK